MDTIKSLFFSFKKDDKLIFRFIMIVTVCCLPLKQFAQQRSVKWISFEELELVNTKNPRKVIIEVYSKDCEWCKKFEKDVLENAVIANYINDNYYLVKAEAFDKAPIRFNGKELFSTNGFHPITSVYLKDPKGTPLSSPTQLFFDEKLTLLNFLKGYTTAKNFEMALSYFGDNYYKKMDWDKFIFGFKGKL